MFCCAVAGNWVASKRCQSWKTMTLSRDYASMAPRQSSLMHYRPQVADGRLLASLGPHSPIRWMRLIIPDGCHGCVICLCVCFVLSRHSSSSCLVAAAWTVHTHHASASVHGHQHSQVHILPLLFLKLLAYALWGRVRACVLAHLIIIVKACMRDSHCL